MAQNGLTNFKMDFIATVKKTILRNSLLRRGDTAMVGVSGGPDSVALLHVLCRLRHEFGFKILVGHINHQLRRSADADQRFVERLGESLHLPTNSFRVQVQKIGQKSSLEELARDERLRTLIRFAKQKKISCIAFAHHRDDLAETVLMRILRGAGLLGLQAMLPRKEIHGVAIIRPFLNVQRSEIMIFLKKNKIPFRIDPTNRHTHFFRNKIRLRLLPLLEREYQPNIKEMLAHLADNAARDYNYLQQQTEKKISALRQKWRNRGRIPLQWLSEMHPSLQHMMIRFMIAELQGDMNRLTFTHLAEIDDLVVSRPQGSVIHLPSGLSIRKKRDSLIFEK